MPTHRFRALAESILGPVSAPAVAFVPCPQWACFAVCQQDCIRRIYEMAAEQAREQMQASRWRWAAEFSLN